jgi:hypothetical protein
MKLLAGVLAVGMGLCAPSSLAAAELRLLMFEQPGCQYCAQWTEEIAPQYPLTDEGRAAPVERVQLRAPLAEGITLTAPPVFTPTFVLLRDGTEVGRIEGYPGEHFFWPLLGQLIAQATQDDP